MFALITFNQRVETLAVVLLLLCCGTWGLTATASAQTPARDSSTKPRDAEPAETPPPPAAVAPVQAIAPPQWFSVPPAAPSQQAPRALPNRRGAVAPAAAPARPRISPQPFPPPPQGVITVVHRLSGWKLLAWLASTPSPVIEVEELPFASDVHTNIVAGFVSEDGRTVFARLGQAEAEAGIASPFEPAISGGIDASADFTLVRRDGQRFKARFIGLDGSTGLSLLEAVTPVIPPAAHVGAQRMSVGQRVRLYAPEPVSPPRAASPPDRESKIFFSLSQSDGRLSEVKSTPSGKMTRASVRAPGLGLTWAGAVATDEHGAVIGIIAEGAAAAGEKQLVTAEGMRAAEARVKARRASVPQPWLGARGDAVAAAKLGQLLARGWPRENARTLLDKGRGILLTGVAPGTPAALAGLRTGDVILRVREHDIKSLDDFSSSLREAGGNATLDLTVLRSPDVAPLRVSVRLSESSDPASATGEAEMRAAEDELRALEKHLSALKTRFGQTEASALTALEKARAEEDLALRAENQVHLAAARNSVNHYQRLLADSRKEFESADRRLKDVAERFAQEKRRAAAPFAFQYRSFNRRPFIVGLNTIAISPKIAARFKAQSGLLVTGVLPQTPAAASGFRPGDVIEAINGQTLPEAELKFEFRTDFDTDFDFDIVREGKKFKLKFSPPDAPAPKKE